MNNNSTDGTVKAALKAGAIVIDETHQGYGAACLRGIQFVNDSDEKADIVVSWMPTTQIMEKKFSN